MELADARGRQRVDVGHGREAVIARAHPDVVHVEEDAAVGTFRDACQKFPLGIVEWRKAT
jgi:hypothetical protein